jgi:hypothetical protein
MLVKAGQQQHRLSDSDVTRYRRDGYLIVPDPVLRPERFAALAAHFEELLAALPPGARPEDMDVPHLLDPALFEWLLDDDVLALVTPILGPDVALFSSHFICKPAGDGKRVPWHQDSFYWKHMLSPCEVATVWLAIDRSDAGNGAMRVIPGTHKAPELEYENVDMTTNTFPKEIKRHLLREGEAVTLELEPNHASLHAAALVHGSEANRSDRRRCGLTIRFVSTRTRFQHETCGSYHQLYLARGRDHAGNVYGDPARAYPGLIEARAGRVRRGH